MSVSYLLQRYLIVAFAQVIYLRIIIRLVLVRDLTKKRRSISQFSFGRLKYAKLHYLLGQVLNIFLCHLASIPRKRQADSLANDGQLALPPQCLHARDRRLFRAIALAALPNKIQIRFK